MHTSVLEDFINSSDPNPLDLSDFYIHVSRVVEFFEAPIRNVNCYRCGIHEYLIIACEVMLPSTRQLTIVWFRLERNPSQKTMHMLSGKPNPAADTVKASTRLELLHSQGDSRGHFVFHTTENPRTVLKLRHILEMYNCFAQKSPSYALLKANCRWLCYGLFECLRQCQPCYGGYCMASKSQSSWSQYDAQAAAEAKNVYLKEKHSECCFPAQRSVSVLRALVAESTGLAAAAASIAGQMDAVVNSRKYLGFN